MKFEVTQGTELDISMVGVVEDLHYHGDGGQEYEPGLHAVRPHHSTKATLAIRKRC